MSALKYPNRPKDEPLFSWLKRTNPEELLKLNKAAQASRKANAAARARASPEEKALYELKRKTRAAKRVVSTGKVVAKRVLTTVQAKKAAAGNRVRWDCNADCYVGDCDGLKGKALKACKKECTAECKVQHPPKPRAKRASRAKK